MVFKCFIYGLVHDEWNLFLWCDPGSEMILRKRTLFMDCVQWYIQTSWLWLHSSYLGDFLLKSYLVTPGGGKPYRSRWFISLHLPSLCKLDCELRFLFGLGVFFRFTYSPIEFNACSLICVQEIKSEGLHNEVCQILNGYKQVKLASLPAVAFALCDGKDDKLTVVNCFLSSCLETVGGNNAWPPCNQMLCRS
jgi:hypothetical protein